MTDPLRHQIHREFMFFRMGPSRLLLTPDPAMLSGLAPKSISVIQSEDGGIICVGYTRDRGYPVKFVLRGIGSETDTEEFLGKAMEAQAQVAGAVISQTLFSRDGRIWALFMVRG